MPNYGSLRVLTASLAAATALGATQAQAQNQAPASSGDPVTDLLGTIPPRSGALSNASAAHVNTPAEDAARPGMPGADGPYSLVNNVVSDGADGKFMISVVGGSLGGPKSKGGPFVGEDKPIVVQFTRTNDFHASKNAFASAPGSRVTYYFNPHSNVLTSYAYTNHQKETRTTADIVPVKGGAHIVTRTIDENQDGTHLSISRAGIRSQQDQNLFTVQDNLGYLAMLVATNAAKYQGKYPEDFRSAIVDSQNQKVVMQMGNWRIDAQQNNIEMVNTVTGTRVNASSQDFYKLWIGPEHKYANLGVVTITDGMKMTSYDRTPGDLRQIVDSSPGRTEIRDGGRHISDPTVIGLMNQMEDAITMARPVLDNHWFNKAFPTIPGSSVPSAKAPVPSTLPSTPSGYHPPGQVTESSLPPIAPAASATPSRMPTSPSSRAAPAPH